MGKKRRRSKKTSNGERRSVARSSLVARTPTEKLFDRQNAISKGKRVSYLEVNPDTDNIRKAPFIRVVR